MTRLRGRGASPGIAVGRAVVLVREARQVRYRLASSGVDRERQRLRTARERTRAQLEEISSRMSRTLGQAQAAIFAAQMLMLDDPLLSGRADELVRAERINADWAIERAVDEIKRALAREGDAWTSERAGDVADVAGRLQRNLRRGADVLAVPVHELEPPLILVADDLPPSVAAQIDWTRVRGLVSDLGSPTQHSVILVRSHGVPAVVGLGAATEMIAPGQMVAIDGTTGEVVVDPTDDALGRWQQRAGIAAAGLRALDRLRDQPAHTADGVRIRLEANLELAEEVGRVTDAGAEGIGLYRSEFLLDAAQPAAASEDMQCATYRSLLEALAPRPVTVRTFDVGEERPAGLARRERFGLRGIRGALHTDERFRTQIRALLRAADAGVLRILLPFVTTAEELRQARAVVADAARLLGRSAQVPVGAMIEVPAAALTVDQLAEHADFLSVGTNDLIQYTLAVDRTDERLAGHYQPTSAAVLRLLRTVAAAGRRAGCQLSVCGEMAADPLLAAILVGLGFRRFSVTPSAIPVLKQSLATLEVAVARDVARRALRARSADEVHDILTPVAEAMHRAAVEAGTDGPARDEE
jgi:phosphotransferase system enzyme I (PtsI)